MKRLVWKCFDELLAMHQIRQNLQVICVCLIIINKYFVSFYSRILEKFPLDSYCESDKILQYDYDTKWKSLENNPQHGSAADVTHWMGSGKNEAKEKLSDMSPLDPSALIW